VKFVTRQVTNGSIIVFGRKKISQVLLIYGGLAPQGERLRG